MTPSHYFHFVWFDLNWFDLICCNSNAELLCSSMCSNRYFLSSNHSALVCWIVLLIRSFVCMLVGVLHCIALHYIRCVCERFARCSRASINLFLPIRLPIHLFLIHSLWLRCANVVHVLTREIIVSVCAFVSNFVRVCIPLNVIYISISIPCHSIYYYTIQSLFGRLLSFWSAFCKRYCFQIKYSYTALRRYTRTFQCAHFR